MPSTITSGNAIDQTRLKAALQKAFPSGQFDDETVLQVAHAIANPPAAVTGPADHLSYYIANAGHSRTLGIRSAFVGHLPLVRLALPAVGTWDTLPVVKTAIGDVFPADRLLASVAQVPQQLHIDQTAERVEVITPARARGPLNVRFGAFATYLCYTKAADAAPSWYILEGGTATGQPRVPYVSVGMGSVNYTNLGYDPTAFSKPSDWIMGTLTMDQHDANEPARLLIKVNRTQGSDAMTSASDPYITVDIEYAKQVAPPSNNPLGIILEAAARVGVIGHHLGIDGGAAEDLAAFFGGLELEWSVPPESL